MPDFTATRTFLYVAGNIISPVQNTTNETGIYTPHNAAFNATSGHTHSGTTGDGPRIPTYCLSDSVTELLGAASPYTVVAADRNILCNTSLGAFTVIIPNPYDITTRSRVLTIADATGNAGLNNITVTINGYGIDRLVGITTSVPIVNDWGYMTILRMASGYWKIIADG